MKKKGNKKTESIKNQEEKKVNEVDLLSEINQYLQINENEKKLKEMEKEKEKEEFSKLHAKNQEILKEVNNLKENSNLEQIYKKAIDIVFVI